MQETEKNINEQDTEDTQPIVLIGMPDGDTRVIPMHLMFQVIGGEKPLSSLGDDWAEIVRMMMYSWLHDTLLKEAKDEV